MTKTIKVLVVGGKVTLGPPLGPALAGIAANVGQIVEEINKKTAEYGGMKVPVEISIDLETRGFEVEVGVPPTSMLILKEIEAEKGSGQPGKEGVGDLTFDQVIRISRVKAESMSAGDIKSLVKTVLGVALSMGVKVEGKDPREIQGGVDRGDWDAKLEEGGNVSP